MKPKQDVASFMVELDHPLKGGIEAVRQIILSVSPAITEGIKWNAPSFSTTDYFATFHLRSTNSVQLIFHRGAKMKDAKDMDIPDPERLLKWLAKDRCMVTLGAGQEILERKAAFENIVREWIRQL